MVFLFLHTQVNYSMQRIIYAVWIFYSTTIKQIANSIDFCAFHFLFLLILNNLLFYLSIFILCLILFLLAQLCSFVCNIKLFFQSIHAYMKLYSFLFYSSYQLLRSFQKQRTSVQKANKSSFFNFKLEIIIDIGLRFYQSFHDCSFICSQPSQQFSQIKMDLLKLNLFRNQLFD
ncbi:hypothetical protein ABPG74_001573 [Tetrahymena malaccensis]